MGNTDRTETDGGRAGTEELFGHGDDDIVPSTRRKRWYRALDLYVYAPLAVAWSDWRMRIGTAILLFYILMGTVGVMIVPEPQISEGPQYVSWFNTMEYPLGTDGLGQDLLELVVHATPAMLKMIIAGAIVASGTAVVIGTVSGYKGGTIDRVLMSLTDVVLTIPGLPLIILIAAIWEPRDPFIVGIILAIDNWPGLARSLRSQVLAIRESSYIEAERAMGVSTPNIVGRDVISQLMPYIMIHAAGAARGVIFESVALYFLGILPFSTFNWGVMMNTAWQHGGALVDPARAGHWLYVPMFAIMLISFGLILFAQGMDRVFNPRLRARHAKTLEASEDEYIEE